MKDCNIPIANYGQTTTPCHILHKTDLFLWNLGTTIPWKA